MAAVIERDGLVLICQRKKGRHALKWEFPGGKVEPGEEPREALARELREELAIDARIGKEIGRAEVSYDRVLRLRFYSVTEFSGEPVNLEFAQMIWERREKLPEYDFLEGDIEFVRKLAVA